MKKLFFSVIVLTFALAACNKERLPADCSLLAEAKIISEKQKGQECQYSEVYRYEGKIYSVPECCTCDMAYMAFDCDGNALCDFTEDCMIDFRENAEYLYAVISD